MIVKTRVQLQTILNHTIEPTTLNDCHSTYRNSKSTRTKKSPRETNPVLDRDCLSVRHNRQAFALPFPFNQSHNGFYWGASQFAVLTSTGIYSPYKLVYTSVLVQVYTMAFSAYVACSYPVFKRSFLVKWLILRVVW